MKGNLYVIVGLLYILKLVISIKQSRHFRRFYECANYPNEKKTTKRGLILPLAFARHKSSSGFNALDRLSRRCRECISTNCGNTPLDRLSRYQRDGITGINCKYRSYKTGPLFFKFGLNDKGDKSGDKLMSLTQNILSRTPLAKPSTQSFEGKGKSSPERQISEKITTKKQPLVNLLDVEALLAASENDVEGSDINLLLTRGNDFFLNEKESTGGISSIGSNPSFKKTGDWSKLGEIFQQNVKDLIEVSTASPSLDSINVSADLLLKEATAKIEEFIHDASEAISPDTVQNLILDASKKLKLDGGSDVFKKIEGIVEVVELIAMKQGLDVSEAATQARATVTDTSELLQAASGLLVAGYTNGGHSDSEMFQMASDVDENSVETANPLFYRYPSARTVSHDEFTQSVTKGVEMAKLIEAVYDDMVPGNHDLDHSLVANGTTSDVAWMVTDSIGYNSEFNHKNGTIFNEASDNMQPILIRTITLRGFDASDEKVDRERLLNQICTANPVKLGDEKKDIECHNGLNEIAKELYSKMLHFIHQLGPNHKVVITGHSVGGSLAVLLLLLLTEEFGADFVRSKVLRVFTYGSPPVTRFTRMKKEKSSKKRPSNLSVLNSFGLPESIVYGYVQPWDPIVRLFSIIDPLYPLIGDLGEDGVTLYASGPIRTLRPVTRAITESWEGWPLFRDRFQGTVNQDYEPVGIQHLLLPEPTRYLSDRLVSVNVAAHPIAEVVQISSDELFPALEETFPLDTFAIRSVN